MKLKTLIKEWGAGGVVSIKAIGNPFKKQNSRMNESIPALGKEYINYQKGKKLYLESIIALTKAAGKVDKTYAKQLNYSWKKTVSDNMKKFEDALKDVLSKLQ